MCEIAIAIAISNILYRTNHTGMNQSIGILGGGVGFGVDEKRERSIECVCDREKCQYCKSLLLGSIIYLFVRPYSEHDNIDRRLSERSESKLTAMHQMTLE